MPESTSAPERPLAFRLRRSAPLGALAVTALIEPLLFAAPSIKTDGVHLVTGQLRLGFARLEGDDPMVHALTPDIARGLAPESMPRGAAAVLAGEPYATRIPTSGGPR